MSALEPWEIRLVRAFNDPLPLCPRPFAQLADQLGVPEGKVLGRLRSWTADGTIRRFGARVNHRNLGFAANGMCVWDVPEDQIETAGAFMAEQPEVSHCYLRPRHPAWPYNLYAMVHGATQQEVRAVAQRIAGHIGLSDHRVLFSSREFKKSAPKWFIEGKPT